MQHERLFYQFEKPKSLDKLHVLSADLSNGRSQLISKHRIFPQREAASILSASHEWSIEIAVLKERRNETNAISLSSSSSSWLADTRSRIRLVPVAQKDSFNPSTFLFDLNVGPFFTLSAFINR